MNNPFKRVTDEIFELGQSTTKSLVNDVVKGIPKAAAGQLASSPNDNSNLQQNESADRSASNEQINSKPNAPKKTDPITGKPAPSKRVLTDLKNAAAQLQMQKLQQVREELAKQRNKNMDANNSPATPTAGPEVKTADKKLDDGAVARTLRASGQTGEFKGSAGGG